MSYNGIGLTTSKGSGTSGYVQKSLSNNKGRGKFLASSNKYEFRKHQETRINNNLEKARKRFEFKGDEVISEHEKRRKLEIICSELRDELEDQELDEEEIDKRVTELRELLRKKAEEEKKSVSEESNQFNLKKDVENQKFRKAFKLNEQGEEEEEDIEPQPQAYQRVRYSRNKYKLSDVSELNYDAEEKQPEEIRENRIRKQADEFLNNIV